jgi:hypothetical protein
MLLSKGTILFLLILLSLSVLYTKQAAAKASLTLIKSLAFIIALILPSSLD